MFYLIRALFFSVCSVCGSTMSVDELGNAYCPKCDDVGD